jgi:predicted metal-binding membrane protein
VQHRLVVADRPEVRNGLPAIVLAVAAWAVVLVAFASGAGAVVRHDRLLQGGPPLWWATVIFVAGWEVMVAAMMVPSSVHAFGRAGSLGHSRSGFAAGYLIAWTAFGLAIFYTDAGVHLTVDHWPWLAEHPWLIAGTTLVMAGTYQFSNLKRRALAACRRLTHLETTEGGLTAGWRHGLDCIVASWGLMLVAFALSAGSLAAMAAITLLMVWEVTPWSGPAVRLAGYALVALGVIVLAGPIELPPWPQL